MPDVRIVLCEHCGTEGRIYRGQYDDAQDLGECPACHGHGSEIVEVEPITEDDLEELAMAEPTKPEDELSKQVREMLQPGADAQVSVARLTYVIENSLTSTATFLVWQESMIRMLGQDFPPQLRPGLEVMHNRLFACANMIRELLGAHRINGALPWEAGYKAASPKEELQ